MNSELMVGDRVLFDPENSVYSHVGCNPVGVKGTVSDIDGDVVVEWDNGEWNVYQLSHADLRLQGRW